MTKQTTAAPPQLADVDPAIAGFHQAMTKLVAPMATDDPGSPLASRQRSGDDGRVRRRPVARRPGP
jgi:hypothetical protein